MLRVSLVTLALLLSLQTQAASPNGSHFKKVLFIIFENTDYAAALKQPYFQQLTTQGALLQNMTGMVHPSQGNYISLLAGDILQVKNDSPVDLSQNNVIDLLEKQGLSWKGYMESYPGNCFTGVTSGRYVRKHNPFISFTDISRDSTRCAKIQDLNAFQQDVNSGNLPNFSILSPNMDNDGHDTGVAFAATWLQKNLSDKLSDSNFLQDTLVIITFDESGKSPGNHIFTVLLGSGVTPGATTAQSMNHVGLLRTIEEEFNLGTLNRLDKSAAPLDGIWK